MQVVASMHTVLSEPVGDLLKQYGASGGWRASEGQRRRRKQVMPRRAVLE